MQTCIVFRVGILLLCGFDYTKSETDHGFNKFDSSEKIFYSTSTPNTTQQPIIIKSTIPSSKIPDKSIVSLFVTDISGVTNYKLIFQKKFLKDTERLNGIIRKVNIGKEKLLNAVKNIESIRNNAKEELLLTRDTVIRDFVMAKVDRNNLETNIKITESNINQDILNLQDGWKALQQRFETQFSELKIPLKVLMGNILSPKKNKKEKNTADPNVPTGIIEVGGETRRIPIYV